ncbi:MAG: dockerin type I domain-containing protein [Rubripirellula sp.]|nr:dockerin type I domain-containing protein [Rubripirellula sp.]
MKSNPGRRRRSVGSKRRKLRLQSLENRNLLAGDVGVEIFASDVNGDGEVTPVDALQVINALQSQNKGGVVEDFSSVDVNKDGVLSPRDALGVINQLNSDRTLRQQSETPLRDRVVERLRDRDPSETLGNGAIREIAQRLAERRGEGESIEGLKELVSTAREDGEVTEEERAEIRERVSTELAERGRDGSNIDPERQERRQERREERRERRGERGSIEGLKELVSAAREDGEVTEAERAEIRERVSTELSERGRDGSNIDPERQERREQLRERIAARRDAEVDSERREQLRERIAARRDADVDPERREQLRERIAARRDADVDPERREQLRERIAARRDADVDPERREQLRERIAARRAVSGAFVHIVQR